jgi:ABC-type branched-subunit amino acid transport system ATPase component
MSALLDARDISKRFSGIAALSGVSMEVGAGEFVGLIGPNGAGKTTFFNCLYGFLRPDHGRVLFEDRDVTRAPTFRRARLGLARTFQRTELFAGMSVREHLLVAERARTCGVTLWRDLLLKGRVTDDERELADRMLALLGLADDAERPIESLSLGRTRLVELGRALMGQPRLLFLDEPSSGLDRIETEEMARVLLEAQREHGTAILLIEHDIDLVQNVTSRLYVLDYGKLIASGETAAVLANPEVRHAYLGVTA